jgi:tryptophanyl-tRNA synthetase
MLKFRILLLSLAVAAACSRASQLTEASVRSQVENLIPIGSDSQRALVVLDSLKVEHSQLGTDHTIAANFGESRNSQGQVNASIHVTLYFGADGKLTKHDVKEVFTGP